MKPTTRQGVVLSLALLTVACRENGYHLRTTARLAGDGRSYLTIEVLDGHERPSSSSVVEMVPGNAAAAKTQQDQGPKVDTFAEFDKEGNGALVTFHVTKDENVLVHNTRFVERPAPAGYVRAGLWNGVPPPEVLDRVPPSFPDVARRNHRQGMVFVEARINPQGTVDSVAVLNPTANWDGLDRAAAEAVRQWRFRPAWRDGHPIAVAAVQKVDFVLP